MVVAAELETQLVRALAAAHRNLNWHLFGDTLKAPVVSLFDAQQTLGLWVPETREIRIQRKFAFEEPWTLVEEVLKHEMAHQFVHEILGKTDETSHGPAFRAVCAERAIDPKAFGRPGSDEPSESRVFQRVSKLLALASSANQHEAELAMSKAQDLMRAHNIASMQANTPRGYGFRQLHAPTARIFEHERWLAAIISDHFFVQVLWVQSYDAKRGTQGRVLEISGTPENLAIAEYVHGFLLQTADRLWLQHKAEQGITKNKDRQRFRIGVMRGFKEKLEAQQVKSEQTGLVWVEDADLQAYFRRRHPHTRSVHRASAAESAAVQAGRAAGRNIVLNKPVSTGGQSRGRLLGSGR